MPAYKKFPQGDPEHFSAAPDWHSQIDSSLRLVMALIQNKDYYQFKQRTGLSKPGKGAIAAKKPVPPLPITISLDPQKKLMQLDGLLQSKFGVSPGYRRELEINGGLRSVTGILPIDEEVFEGKTAKLKASIAELLTQSARTGLGVPVPPSRGPALGEIGMPPKRKYKGEELTGSGVVVGIIDDGCAFAHGHFIRKRNRRYESRIRYLWDQAGVAPRAGWDVPRDKTGTPDFTYGLELKSGAIGQELNRQANWTGSFLEEDKVYKALGYRPGSVASHGTHVMDIAAGNGRSLMGEEGVACDADIIFVQLPPEAIELGAREFEQHVMAGVSYIFQRAGNTPAVINISYGGYDGPHDGTSDLERHLDGSLGQPGRAIVVSAGNGFEANCHASETVKQNEGWYLRWILPPVDPTDNNLEIWYEGNLEVRLKSPGPAITPVDWIQLGYPMTEIKLPDGNVVGHIEHQPSPTGNNANKIYVNLRATDAAARDGSNAPAPDGTWTVELRNPSNADVIFHAWIHRDDAGHPASSRLRQSRFHVTDAKPGHTITGWACGSKTISVGAYNAATDEVSQYSACGPARPIGAAVARAKPDIYAPAEQTVRGSGILSASSLSARPTPMNGTSAAAPHVTGLIALIFEYAGKRGPQAQGAQRAVPASDKIRDALVKCAGRGSLKPNRFQLVNDRVPVKQDGVWAALVSSGKADLLATLKELFP